ncbi:PQQ-binding-like beta-propeller repeat protein [Candidatus Fermentibacterales bacterium]|nr:PQQ-binding-like beta-propeller repeat protein [Candidatus Fermentibacterales bacterium]
MAFVMVMMMALTGADWSNSGGNQGRNCLTEEVGPIEADLLWSGGRTSLIAWQPVTEGNLLFVVRQAAWPGTPGDSPVVCMDLSTGGEEWAEDIPYATGDWITWIAGVMNGLVFASRGGNGASVSAPLYALDVTDGSVVWVSDDEIDAGAYDGVVFAGDGDPVIASFRDIWRIDCVDGSTEWHASRTASVSGECGGCIHGDGFYVVDAVPGGHAFVKYDLETGAELYHGPVMSGFTAQCTPMAGPDGTLYFNRSQSNPAVDYFYAFEDTGTGFTEKWHIPTVNAAGPEFGVGPDGSVYFVIPGPCLARVDPDDGTVLAQTDTLPDYSKCRLALDADGTVFFSNGSFAGGRLYAFTANLDPLWDTAVTNINIGGPALGQNGTVVVCGIGTDVRAYRSSEGIPGMGPAPAALSICCLPNPSSGPVTVSLSGPRGEHASLAVFDLSGRMVADLGELETSPEGAGVVWDPGGPGGGRVPCGTYLIRCETPAGAVTARLVVL